MGESRQQILIVTSSKALVSNSLLLLVRHLLLLAWHLLSSHKGSQGFHSVDGS